jgi:hypothetical protein
VDRDRSLRSSATAPELRPRSASILRDAVALSARLDVAAAIERLEPFDPGDPVVVVHDEDVEAHYFVYEVRQLRSLADRLTKDRDPTQVRLSGCLDVQAWLADPTVQLADGPPAVGTRAVVLDGVRVVGVAEPCRRTARNVAGYWAPTRPTADRGATGGASAASSQAMTARSHQPADAGTADSGDPQRTIAYPRTRSPAAVATDEHFELTVGLTDLAPTGGGHAPIGLPTGPRRFDLVVQVIAPEFAAPEGVRRFLHVDLTDGFDAAEVDFRLVAGPVGRRQHRTLEVEFSYEGVPLGRAWRDIEVVPAGTEAAAVRPTGSGATTLHDPDVARPPDVTVTVTEGGDDGHLVWLFTTPHDVELPIDHQVQVSLGRDNARSFAQRVLRDVPRREGTALIVDVVRGAARQIAGAMPAEFFAVLEAVWRVVGPEGRRPTLLLTSSDAYVPWELASLEDDWLDPALLDPRAPPLLGAQVVVGRWLSPLPRTPRGGERPVQPPRHEVTVHELAVVVGDYLDSVGMRDLPEARAEGRALLLRHGGLALTATEEQMAGLLNDRLERDGEPLAVQAVHFACHGVVDLDNPAYNGIVLNDDRQRLDAMTLSGNLIGRRSEPFAFVNACQLGTCEEGLVGNLGYAGAFINEGFRGFLAPLWAVDDEVARHLAEEFYERTLEGGEGVGEVLRSLRCRFDMDAQDDAPPSTYLAYTFYGHPELVLARA